MSCATTCLKCLVILCNILLVTIGLVMLGGGIFLMIGSQKYINQYSEELVRSIEKHLGNWTSSMDGGDHSMDFSAYTTPLGIVLIVFGAFITLVGFIGIFGVCCSNRILLVIYAIVTILLVTAEIIITILFFSHVFDEGIRDKALDTLTERYVGIMDLGQDSLPWNYIMIKHQCCGLDSYKDFASAKKWFANEIPSNSNLSNSDLLLNATQVTPVACCKEAMNLQYDSDFTCSTSPTNQTSNWQTGCWDAVSTALLSYRTLTIGIISAIVVAQALLALMALLIAWRLPHQWKNL